MNQEIGELVVKECKADEFAGEVDLVFSGLDSDVAGEAGKCIIFLVNSHFSKRPVCFFIYGCLAGTVEKRPLQ